MDACVSATINAAKDLSRHLAQAALQQAQELTTATKQGQELVTVLRQQALVSDLDRLHHTSNSFHDSIDHILEVGCVICFDRFIPQLKVKYLFVGLQTSKACSDLRNLTSIC